MQHSRRRPAAALSPVTLNNHSTRASRQCTRNVTPVVSSCFGCSQPMYTPTLSTVLDHNWHPECVRCFVCRCLLNEQCYSREGKLYCKDDFIKKYIHRCFACQNLLQANEMIRRIRPGRLYHADCFVCSKCKHTLQDNDISALFKTDGSTFNEMECLCQTCLNPDKLSVSNQNRDDKVNGEHSVKTEEPSVSQTNGSILPNPTTNDHSENNEQESMEVDETTMVKSSPIKKRSSSSNSSAQAPPISTPLKATGRQSKARQSTSSNGSKRSPAKSKATPPTARQKEPSTNERKGRSPATRSKASATPPSSSVASRRSSNRRTKKPARYGKRRYVSGSDDNDTEDDEDDDEIDDHSDFTNEDENDTNEKDTHQSPVPPKATPIEVEIKNKTEPEPTVAPPPVNGGTPSLLSQVKMSEPLSLLSGLASNPMSISSIMKPDMNASFMPPNFNPAFPNPAQFLPPNHPFQPGFSLPPRLPMAVPPVTAPPPTKSTRTSHSPNDSENESLDHSSSSSQMDVSVNAESGPPTRPPTTATTKPSALSSLLEFGKLPPSNLPDIRPNGANPSPFPFPFVNPGPGVPFSPQAAAGMATFYRPPFGVPSVSSMPLDMSQSSNNGPKKKATPMENDETGHHQHLLQDSNSSKKKAKKSNSRSKGKGKKNDTEVENGLDDDNPLSSSSPPPAPPSAGNGKKKKMKGEPTGNGHSNNDEEKNKTNGNSHPHPHNILAQMSLLNNSFMPSSAATGLPPSASTNGKTSPANAQQAQLAAMYSMAPHFAAYNPFPGAFNPAFAAAAYASGYPNPYGFHPAFGAAAQGQPFPFMPPTPSPLNNPPGNDDKSQIGGAESRPVKSRSKNTGTSEKKKSAAPRTNKKKASVPQGMNESAMLNDIEGTPLVPSGESMSQMAAATPDSSSTPSKRRMSDDESDDFDDQPANYKSGYDSDESIDRAINASHSASSNGAEKKGGRTTIKPQQLEILCKAYETCSKPNKAQREQLVAETGLSLRVIQVWFQNKRSKERKGKVSDKKEMTMDDGEDDESRQSFVPDVQPSESLAASSIES